MIPMRDLFSYSKPDGVWFAWEWLSDLLFAWLNAHGGLAAVAMFAILIISIAFTIRISSGPPEFQPDCSHLVVTMIAAAASSIHWLARPHLFTLLFLVLFYCGAGARARRVRQNTFWRCFRGHACCGPTCTAASLSESSCRRVRRGRTAEDGPRPDPAVRREAPVRQALLPLRFGLPGGQPGEPVHLSPACTYVEYLRDPYQSQHIMEFLSHQLPPSASAIFFEAMLLLGAGAAFWSFARRSYMEAVLIVGLAHGALLAARNIPLFMIVAAPPVAAMLAEWLARCPQFEVAGMAARRGAQIQRRIAARYDRYRSHRPLARGERGGALPWWRRCCSRRIRPRSSAPNSIRRTIPPRRVDRISRDELGQAVPRASSPTTSGATT